MPRRFVLLLAGLATLLALGLPIALWHLSDSASADGTGFRMNFLVKAPSGVCDDAANPTSCDLPLGATFTLSMEVIDPPTPYQGVQTEILYEDLVYQPTALAIDEIVWPDVLGFARSPSSPTGTEGEVVILGNTSSQAPYVPSYYIGAVMQISLRCTDSMSTNAVKLATSNEVPSASSAIGVITGSTVQVVQPKAALKIADTVSINCISSLPTYTPAPATPTPTASATPVPPEEDAGMDLTVMSGGICDAPEKPAKCSVLLGGTFELGVMTNDRPAGGYQAIQTLIGLGGLVHKPSQYAAEEIPWPDCVLPVRGFNASQNTISHGCLTAASPPHPISTFSGNLVRFTVTCPATSGVHVLRLVPNSDSTPNGSGYKRAADPAIPASDELPINCVSVLPTPTPIPPTPASLGGVSFAAPGGGAGGGASMGWLAMAAIAVGAVVISGAGWYMRRRAA